MLFPVVRRVALFTWTCVAALGCKSPTDKGTLPAAPSGSSVGSASALSSMGAPSPIASGPASTKGASGKAVSCDLRWGFFGKVAGQEAFLRLKRDGARVVGRYFYKKVGVDIALAGTIDETGALSLSEGDEKAPTARFVGTCSEQGGLAGQWRGSTDQPFSFERVASRDKPMVATKRLSLVRKAKSGGTLRIKECRYDQRVAELFGAGTPEAERLLNQQDEATLFARILDRGAYDDTEKCEIGLTASFGAGVVTTFAGLVTLEQVGTFTYASAAHPANAVGYARATYDLSTGRPVTESDLFSSLPKALVDKCVAAYVKAHDLDEMPIVVDGKHFDVAPKGIHFYGAEYPHALAALTGNGPTVSWGALLRVGALKATSSARRAWAGEKANPDESKDCIVEEPKL